MNSNTVIYVPCKCSIHFKDEIIAEVKDMVTKGVMRKIDEPTDWVNSFVFIRKSNEKLNIYLDSKDQNKTIKRCHYKTSTLEETSYKLANANKFMKMDTKNCNWSVNFEHKYMVSYLSLRGIIILKKIALHHLFAFNECFYAYKNTTW